MTDKELKGQSYITDKYRSNHVRRGIWYRIISALSVIMVFCTTYALMLPALTMEDPSAGIKLQNAFEYEDDSLSITFYVSGRAVFKNEVDIENPIADNVVLNIKVLEDTDSAYAEYAEYAEKNIGKTDLAQLVAFELDFWYLEHELDVSKCDIVAEIDAKDVFFVDKIGSVPDRSVYVADTSHPMATPSDEKVLDPAKAVTAIQGTVLSIADQPVVYTTETSEVDTLTIDVKGDSLAVFTSETDNYEFKVAYYTRSTRLSFMDAAPTEGEYYWFHDRRVEVDNFDYRETDDRQYLGTAPLTYVALNKVIDGTNLRAYQLAREYEYIQLYKTVTYDFANYSMIKDINKLINSNAYNAVELVTGVDEASLTPEISDYYAQLGADSKYKYSQRIKFTTNESLASNDVIYVGQNDTMILIYDQISTALSDDVTLFDYDITPGYHYQSATASLSTATPTETSKQNNSLYSYSSSYRQGINSYGTNNSKPRFTFGERSSFADFEIVADLGFGNVNINQSQMIIKNGLVTGISVDENGDFVPVFNDAVSAPDIFSTNNDYIPSFIVTDGLSDRFVATNHGDDSTVWKNLWGTARPITLPTSGNSYFDTDCYVLAYGDNIVLPCGKSTNYGGFALEVKFGEIEIPANHSGFINLLRHQDSGSYPLFNLYINTSDSSPNENDLFINSIGNLGVEIKIADDAVNLLSNSLLTIVYDTINGYLRIFVDGVEIFNRKGASTSIDFTNYGLVLGSYQTGREVYMEITDIRYYNHPLKTTEVAQNAKNLNSYAPVVSNGLIAEFDADKYSTTTNTWTPSQGTVSDIDLSNAKYTFDKGACIVTGGNYVTLPDEIAAAINASKAFTIEVEFGNIKGLTDQYVNYICNSVPENYTQFALRSGANDNNFAAQVCFGGGQWEIINAIANNVRDNQHYSVENMQYSTVTVTFDGTTLRLFINGHRVAHSTQVNTFNLDGLVFGPSQEGVVSEYRTMRFYDRALSNIEVIQNSRHDGTYNLGYDDCGGELEERSEGSVGKTVLGGRYIEFKQTGDTYVLSGINVSTSSSDKFTLYNDLSGLDYFSKHTLYAQDNNSKSNDYWPMDNVKTYGANGHDFKYGDQDFETNRKFYDISNNNATRNALLSYNSSDHNSFFGTKYKIDFTLTADYVGPLEYIFMGDDDLWVFLDDQLVCDISGVHGAIGQVVDLWNYVDRYDRTEDTDHTLYVLLLERGARASTCYMEFTLPSVSNLTPENPTGTLTLSKEVVNSSTQQAFDFTLNLTDAEGVALTDVLYNVIDADGSFLQTNVAFTNGSTISLANGQSVVIEYLPLDAKYTITEKEYTGYHTSYDIIGDKTYDSNTATGTVGTRTGVVFYNTTGSMLPSTGSSSVGNSFIYVVPLCIACAYMCAMPFINRPKRRVKIDN